MTETEDLHIISQIKAGNSKAFSVLVDRYKNLVFTLALKMLENREEAEEVAQDVFIKVFNYIGTFNGDSKISTWIYKITYNTCLDYIKKLKKARHQVSINEITVNQLGSVDALFDQLDKEDRKTVVAECLQQLSPDENFLMVLFYFEEKSLLEISKIVHLKVNHLKVKLFRIRKKLASLLKDKLEPETVNYYEKSRR